MRIGKAVWHAKRKKISNAEIAEYEKPTKIITRFNYFTVMPAVSRGFMEVVKSGETLYDTWTATANGRYFDGQFGVGDLMWLDGDEPPMQSELSKDFGYKQSATAEIKSVSEVNLTIDIRLERNQG